MYSKTKKQASSTSKEGMFNSAKSSLNSFSGKLEKRRQADKDARKQKEESS